jgi:SPP1 gp7 family putative phage head morphogenesis protein
MAGVMPAFSLTRLARAKGKRRNVTLRPIIPTKAMATDLAAILIPAATIWAQASASILAGYDPKPLGDSLTHDSPDQVQAAIDTTSRDFFHRLVTEITPALRRWATRVEGWHRDKWTSAVKAGTDVDLSMVLTSLGTEDTIAAFVARNVALAQNVSDEAQGRIADAVFRGYQAHTPARDVAKEVKEATDMGRARAVRIASDQLAKLSAALDLERHAEAGIEQYRWRHSHKAHPRPVHVARDGQMFPLNQPRGDTPGQAPFCGCRAQAYLPIMDEI